MFLCGAVESVVFSLHKVMSYNLFMLYVTIYIYSIYLAPPKISAQIHHNPYFLYVHVNLQSKFCPYSTKSLALPLV